jgi:hypothetical protein
MTKECFMTIRFESEVVRRHFLNDTILKVIMTSDCEEHCYEDEVAYALPDQPYFDADFPATHYNFLTIQAANQVVNQGISDSNYGVDSAGYSRSLTVKNAATSFCEEDAALGVC